MRFQTRARLVCGSLLVFCTLVIAGCHSGKPVEGAEGVRPDQVTDFSKLYKQNCAGCHGANGQHGAAIALGNPEYQAIVDDATLHNVIANGEPGTLMPAFAQSAGGMLTDAQVDSLVRGLRSSWRQENVLNGTDVPPYATTKQGDPAHGQEIFTSHCATCHSGAKDAKAGSVTDGSYLALISDQSLRAIIIAGRPDLGHPDWRNALPGHPMTDQDVTDVVAWMASQRQKTPGQPYPSQAPAQDEEKK